MTPEEIERMCLKMHINTYYDSPLFGKRYKEIFGHEMWKPENTIWRSYDPSITIKITEEDRANLKLLLEVLRTYPV